MVPVTVTALNTDAELELAIAEAHATWMIAAEAALHAPREDARRFKAVARREFKRMTRLIARRSPERVEQMERERNLR